MSETLETKRRPGRPAKGKRGNFTFRVTEKLRVKLEASAAAENLSVSEDIERRLESTFSGKSIVEELVGGPETFRLLTTIGQAVRMVEETTGKKWTDDYETVAATKIAMKTIIDLIREPADDRPMSFANLFGPSDLGMQAAVEAVTEARKVRAEALASGALIPSKKKRRRRKS